MVISKEIELVESAGEHPNPIPKIKKLVVVAEPKVKAAGPLFAWLGFSIFPFIWSIPEALITSELATAYHGNRGYGSMMGSLKFLSGLINNAAYPVLIKDYLKTIIVFNFLETNKVSVELSWISYCWLDCGCYCYSFCGAIYCHDCHCNTKIKLSRLMSLGKYDLRNFRKNDWIGEVENPQLFYAGIIVCLEYLLSLSAAIRAIKLKQGDWKTGYFSDAGGMIGGTWLKIWVNIGSVVLLISSIWNGKSRVLPSVLTWRSKYFNTSWVGIVLSSAITFGLTFVEFENIVNAANFLYILGMLLDFSALNKPYKVPASVPFICILCLIPAGFVVLLMRFTKLLPIYISAGLTCLAICNYFLMNYLNSKGCIKFSNKDGDEHVVEKISMEQ
ncbi:hypothetical protein MKW94_008840 [Papaver nudicaule]|uniref:Uncharacterized protein n=1 Tax=Papaver nudicaule TaxID=74823 RepID=A0AA42B5J4_PAPNU|nr:hypothetical protein [Papaver nudicaule]